MQLLLEEAMHITLNMYCASMKLLAALACRRTLSQTCLSHAQQLFNVAMIPVRIDSSQD
jgi:hypothetical protein